MSESETDCFGWRLGKPVAVKPTALIQAGGSDDFEEFFLALALVFNDLKSMALIDSWLSKKGRKGDLNAEDGQVDGVRVHIARLSAGIFHELLNLIEKKRSVLADTRFAEVLAKVEPAGLTAWQKLVTEAQAPAASAAALAAIRNATAFHYYQPKAIALAFRSCFFDDPKNLKNENAYLSWGNDMDATRFYYADAAAQRCMRTLSERTGNPDLGELMERFVNDTNFALAHLVRAYIETRAPESGVKGAVSKPTRTP